MKPLSQYQVSFPFGATSSPYSSANPHYGDDIAAPTGTPIDVNGQVIGYVGSTGLSTGPHCHVDKNKQLWVYQGFVNPGDWKTVTGTVVFAEDAGTAGLCVVIQASNGYFYRFLHMSKINVKAGDNIGVKKMSQSEAEKVVTYFYLLGTGNYPSEGQAAYWVPRVKDVPTGIDELGKEMVKIDQASQKPSEYEQVKELLYRKKV